MSTLFVQDYGAHAAATSSSRPSAVTLHGRTLGDGGGNKPAPVFKQAYLSPTVGKAEAAPLKQDATVITAAMGSLQGRPAVQGVSALAGQDIDVLGNQDSVIRARERLAALKLGFKAKP